MTADTPTNTPAPASEAADVEPFCWVMPGTDNVRDGGWIDAMAWREGEFSKPLYASPSAEVERLTREVERLREAMEKIEAHPIRTPVAGRPCAGLPGYPACQDIARAALQRESSTALESGKTEGGGE